MTISSAINRVDYVGNGATAVYPYTYRIFSNTDLLVTVRDDAAISTQYTLVLGTDYTVSGVGGASGNVTLVNASQVWLTGGFLKTGWALTIRRVRPLTQTTDIRNGGPFFAATHEDVFDILTMLSQQLQDQVNRSLKLKETEAGTVAFTQIPVASERASKVLGFDASGNAIAVTSVTTSGVTVSAYILTLLDDVDAATARTTLGFTGTGGTVVAANLNVDVITGQTALTTPDSPDLFIIYDDSAAALRKVSLLNAIAGGTAGTTADTADKVPINDVSTGGAVRVLTLGNLLSQGHAAETTILTDDEILVYDASATALRRATIANSVLIWSLLGGE